MTNNKRLKEVFKLSSRITLYIPSTIDVDQEIDNISYVDKAARLFADLFGGSTSTPALGYWVSANKGLIKEKTTLVFAYCSDKDLQEKVDKVIDYCIAMKIELQQEAVSLEINGEMYFI